MSTVRPIQPDFEPLSIADLELLLSYEQKQVMMVMARTPAAKTKPIIGYLTCRQIVRIGRLQRYLNDVCAQGLSSDAIAVDGLLGRATIQRLLLVEQKTDAPVRLDEETKWLVRRHLEMFPNDLES